MLKPGFFLKVYCHAIQCFLCLFVARKNNRGRAFFQMKHAQRESCLLLTEVYIIEGGVEKKMCTNSHKKRKGGGSANAPHCARSASDPRARPFFPLSATKALRTTALVLVSQGFGCPTVVQDPFQAGPVTGKRTV